MGFLKLQSRRNGSLVMKQNFLPLEEDEDKINLRQINYKDCLDLILNCHYAKRIPQISYAFGLFEGSHLNGCITFGSPASPFVAKSVGGKDFKQDVLELNRLVFYENKKNQASMLISYALKNLPRPKIIVSYADAAQNHLGIVYQASNFYFTGTTKERTDIFAGENKHPRHHLGVLGNRIKRSSKHRYIKIVGSKTDKKIILKKGNFQILSFPKKKKNETVA